MPLTREERKLLHQKSKQPTFGVNEPDFREGHDGDISFRQVENSGTVQYVKRNGDWLAMSSSGVMPPSRSIQGSSSTSGGVTDHSDLSSLGVDDHPQYLLIDGTRDMDSVLTIGGDADGTDRSITWGHSTLKTIMGIDDSSDAFVINTDAAFEGTLADNSFSIDASDNVIIRGNITSGGDLTITGGDIIYGNGQNATNTITATAHNAAGKNLTISAGNTTAGTTNNIAGGALTLQGGQGKGSGAGGDIVFKTANAGSSGSSLNSLATALTISDDLSGTFAGDVSVGDDLFLTSSGSIVNWNSGDVTLTHASGKLTFGGDGAVELDFNNHEMTNVDIDSGAIDGTTIGSSSHTTIKGTTIDATTDFTIGGLVITDGAIDDTGSLIIDGATGVRIQEGGVNVIEVDTNQYIYFHAYADDINYQNYALNNKVDNYHFTTGYSDYVQNYSLLAEHFESSSFNTNYGS